MDYSKKHLYFFFLSTTPILLNSFFLSFVVIHTVIKYNTKCYARMNSNKRVHIRMSSPYKKYVFL
jgi:hypothetical protein